MVEMVSIKGSWDGAATASKHCALYKTKQLSIVVFAAKRFWNLKLVPYCPYIRLQMDQILQHTPAGQVQFCWIAITDCFQLCQSWSIDLWLKVVCTVILSNNCLLLQWLC